MYSILLIYLSINMNISIIIICIILALAINIGRKYLIKKTLSKLTDYIYFGDFSSFEKLINMWYIKYLIKPYNIDFLKLNKALLSNNDEEIEKCFARFENVKMTDIQAKNVYQKAFFYYLKNENINKLIKYYSLINNLEDKTLLNEINDIYKIVVEKNTELLNKYLERYNANKYDSMAAYLLYHIYNNIEDKNNYKKYYKIFNELVEKGNII